MNRRLGVVTAFVSEIDTEHGRVMLEYRGIEDDLQSHWAPIASPMSGGSRGQLFMPEIGDEALVAFADGDFNHPYVVGFLWNGEQTSPEDEAFNRVIVTPGGHQLRFEDKENDTRIILRSVGGHELVLEDIASGPLARLTTDGGRQLLLDDTPANGKAELSSTQHAVTLDDTQRKVTIDAGHTVVITLDATAPSLSIAVGADSVTVGPSGVEVTAAGSVKVTAGGSAEVTVGGSAQLTTGGAATISVGGAASVSVGGAASITAGGAVSLTAGGAVSVTATALSVNAGVSVFSGVLMASTVITSSVVSPSYTPGAGNLL